MTFTHETVDRLLTDGRDLFQAHAQEDLLHPDILLDLDEDHYRAGEQLGMYRTFGMRDDGRLVGYAVFAVLRSPLHRSSLQANLGALYVDSAHRTVGPMKFLHFIESALRAQDVQLIRFHAIPDSGLARLLAYHGYTLAHYEFEKRLDTPCLQ